MQGREMRKGSNESSTSWGLGYASDVEEWPQIQQHWKTPDLIYNRQISNVPVNVASWDHIEGNMAH